MADKQPQLYILKDDGVFPNSRLPVLHYKNVLRLPVLFPALYIRRLFRSHGWSNSWKNSIYTYHHYHGTSHEVLGVCKGKSVVQLGGESGIRLMLEEGDVLVIPAGVAHKNLGKEKDITCVGAYPDGREYDMNYGHPDERPRTDRSIASIPLPETDPVFGAKGPLPGIWGKHS